MSSHRPLPRSLDPLPDESLPGYLLRLAHRLDLAPARVVARTVCAPDRPLPACRTSHELIVTLDQHTRREFAAATRLSENEVDQLCLHSFSPRYPIPKTRPTANSCGRYGSQAQEIRWWLFTSASRYCPECLAGDGSAIQDAHGGPWRRSWRLPVVFACTQHRRLLHHLCPGCVRPAHGAPYTRGRVPLLAGIRIHGLHPAQCRWTSREHTDNANPDCAARLDRNLKPVRVPADALAFQERLLKCLHAGQTPSVTVAGAPTEPLHYFTDLRLLTHLIHANWSLARNLLPGMHFTEAVDVYVDRPQDHYYDGRLPASSTLPRPLDPAAGAGLLTVADHILSSPNPQDMREILQYLLPASVNKARRENRGKHFADAENECSQGLLWAVSPLVKSYSRNKTDFVRAPELVTRLQPCHIPQRIPAGLYHRHLRGFDGQSEYALRCHGALRLFQMCFGGPLRTAADHLRMNLHGHRNRPKDAANLSLARWARSRADPFEFDKALAAIAADLEHAELIDYRRRRDILLNWSISPSDWHTIIESVVPERPQLLADWHRHYGSILVWSIVTSGERRFAPSPIRLSQDPQTQHHWRTAPSWAKPYLQLSYAATLIEALDTFAEDLTRQIDETSRGHTS